MGMERNDVTDDPSWRNSPGVGDEEAVAAPVGLPAVLPSRSARVRSGWQLGGEPRSSNHWPPPPIYSTARRGPTSHVIGLGVPDQDARLRPRQGRWAKSSGDQTNMTTISSLVKDEHF
jgi:hypothetical protein